MTETQAVNEMATQIVLSGLVSYSIEFVKTWAKVPWINASTRNVNRAVSAAIAFFVAIGIHYQFDVQAGSLVITGLTLQNLLHGCWEWARQIVWQQLIYNGVIKKGQGA